MHDDLYQKLEETSNLKEGFSDGQEHLDILYQLSSSNASKTTQQFVKLDSMRTESLNTSSGSWTVMEDKHFYYNQWGNIIKEHYSRHSTYGVYMDRHKTFYQYDYLERNIGSLTMIFDTVNGKYDFDRKVELIINLYDEITQVTYKTYDQNSSKWKDLYRMQYWYGSNGLVDNYFRQNWDDQGQQFVNEYKYSYTYYNNGHRDFLFQNWENNQWVDWLRSVTYFDGNGRVSQSTTLNWFHHPGKTYINMNILMIFTGELLNTSINHYL